MEMSDVYIPSFMCPHCNTKCSFGGVGLGDSVVLYCRGCGKGVYFLLSGWNITHQSKTIRVEAEEVGDYYPKTVLTINPAIPQEIGDDFDEANKCLGVEAKKATVTMCRRT